MVGTYYAELFIFNIAINYGLDWLAIRQGVRIGYSHKVNVAIATFATFLALGINHLFG